MPITSSRFLEYVLKNNIYQAYSSLKGIETVLFHLSNRIKHNVWLNNSIEIFKQNEQILNSHFKNLFKEAKNKFIV